MNQTTPRSGQVHGFAVEVKGARRSYGALKALDDVSLSVGAGEFVSLLGPSGSGKTTLLNVLAGFDELDSGEVSLGGKVMRGVPPHKRGLGMVFQSYSLFPNMTVADNVAYPLKIAGTDRGERTALVVDALKMVELERESSRLPEQLSGGQQQRVSLARAIIHRPKLLLMDEPLGALDRRLRQALQFQIKEIHEKLRTTIIYVTHDQEEALAMSDRIAVMHAGRIEQMDTPVCIYKAPSSSFVASFLGDTNLIPIEVKSFKDNAVELELGSKRLRLQTPSQVEELGSAYLSLRPEDITMADAATDHSLPAKVSTVMFMGPTWRVSCDAGLHQPLVLSVPAEAWNGLSGRAEVHLTIKPFASVILRR